MVRQYDYKNKYYCPSGTCLQDKNMPPGWTGPAAAFKQCSNGEAPKVWNSVYDADTKPPTDWPEAKPCSSASDGNPNRRVWFIAGGIGAAILGMIILFMIIRQRNLRADYTMQ